MLLQPFHSPLIWQMLHPEVGETCLEALAIRTCGNRAYLQWTIVLHPEGAHHGIFLVVEAVEELDGIKSANCFELKVWNGFVKWDDAPIGGMMGHYGRDVEFAINELDAELHVVLMILTNHHAGLIKTGPVVATHLDFSLKLTSVCSMEEGTVIDRETIMSDTPIVGLCRYIHLQHATLYVITLRFVEPLHLFK